MFSFVCCKSGFVIIVDAMAVDVYIVVDNDDTVVIATASVATVVGIAAVVVISDVAAVAVEAQHNSIMPNLSQITCSANFLICIKKIDVDKI